MVKDMGKLCGLASGPLLKTSTSTKQKVEKIMKKIRNHATKLYPYIGPLDTLSKMKDMEKNFFENAQKVVESEEVSKDTTESFLASFTGFCSFIRETFIKEGKGLHFKYHKI